MKRLFFQTVLFFTTGLIFAQATSLTLINYESDGVYYALDPVFAEVIPAAAIANDSFTTSQKLQFNLLVAGSSTKLPGLSSGTHTIVGFWGGGGRNAFSVWG